MTFIYRSILFYLLGLLTVDPKRRLTLMEILAHDWLCGRVEVPTTPLMTPDILDMSGSHVGTALRVAMNVYHKAARAGFTLMDVANAPLAKRTCQTNRKKGVMIQTAVRAHIGHRQIQTSNPIRRPKRNFCNVQKHRMP